MAEAVEHSFQYLTASDLDAIATYIATVPPVRTGEGANRFDKGQPGSKLTSMRGLASPDADDATRGAMLFQGNCGSCHGPLGQGGKDGYFPGLFHNSATGATNSNLVATILNGVDRTTATGQAFMPGFGGRPTDSNQLSDHDIALIGTYGLAEYGPSASVVTDADVAMVRQGGPSSSLVLIARISMGLGAAAMVILSIALIAWRSRKFVRQTG
jgi:mono/diheme cytochrome c family protein